MQPKIHFTKHILCLLIKNEIRNPSRYSISLKGIGCFFKFHLIVGVEESIMNALYRLRITDQLFKSYAFTRVVRSQSTLQRLLRGETLKNTRYICHCIFRLYTFSI
jgi:hypothetical protein